MYFIPLGLFVQHGQNLDSRALDWPGFVHNLIPVTLGNLFGGAMMVGLVYWVIYRRGANQTPPRRQGIEGAHL